MGQTRTRRTGAKLKAALDALLQGDEGPVLFSRALFICRNEIEASELVAEACYRAVRAQRRYKPSMSLLNWLSKIMRNVFRDLRKSAASQHNVSLGKGLGEEDCAAAFLAESGAPIIEVLEREEQRKGLTRALSGLPARYQRIVELCIFQGLSYQAAARVLGVPLGTVRSRLWRARAALGKNPALGKLFADNPSWERR